METKNESGFIYRKAMTEDLLKKHLNLNKKSNYKTIENLLGKSDLQTSNDTIQLAYTIQQEFGTDIDPIKSETLIINFDKDSVLRNWNYKIWEKKN